MMEARAVSAPISALSPLYPGADLLDAFAIGLPKSATQDIEVLARAVLENPAWWIRALTKVRDFATAVLGFKSTARIKAAATQGAVIGYLPVLSRSLNEVVVGADDRHLNFRSVFLLRINGLGQPELVTVTVVQCHDWLGRSYLAAITPFHRAIVRTSLDRAIGSLQPSDTRSKTVQTPYG